MNKTKRLLAMLLAFVFLMVCVPVASADEWTEDSLGEDTEYSEEAEDGSNEEKEQLPEIDQEAAAYELLNNEGTGYFYYYRDNFDKEQIADASIVLPVGQATLSNGAQMATQDGRACVLMNKQNASVQYTFTVAQEGLYAMSIAYKPLLGNGKDINWHVTMDGKTPYDELAPTTLPLIWKDELKDGAFRLDEDGNELRPTQIEVSHWTDAWLQDTTGQYNEPYLLYLTAGSHTVRFAVDEQALYLGDITFGYPEEISSYEDYKSSFAGAEDAAEYFELEVEYSTEKSSSMLYPTYDRATPATTPNNPGKTCLNTIGGGNWGKRGDYITWKINVPASGYYNIAMRARQSLNEGLTSYRTLLIDGKVPFTEADAIAFKYNLNWRVNTLGDGEKPVYLTAGEHTITMVVGTGEVAAVLRELNQVVLDLNTIYRKIIMITSVTPDVYQDYELPANIPELLVALESCAERLEKMSADMKSITGSEGGKAYLFDEMAVMLRDFVKKPYSISERLSKFKSNIESLGSLLLSLGDMPIELDKIYFVPADEKVPNGKCGLWDSLTFTVQAFFSSFAKDYVRTEARDEEGKANIQVWISTGRDQAQIIRRLIDDDFTLKTGNKVQLSITDTGTTLIQATLAGKGPHAGLCITKDTPINLAMRGGLVDLTKYNVQKIVDSDEYYKSAFQPYWYLDGLYAIPETQTFSMLFYRTDIFEELHLSVPQTWEEFYKCIEVVQGNNLTVGMLETNSVMMGVTSAIEWFNVFLFQNGGTYFNKDMSATVFHEEVALDAFTTVVDLYKEYGLDRDFNFYNRFRSGEMPLGITAYTQYNMLSYAAPEINGLWAFAPIPGTVMEDGSINRADSSSGTACMMLNKAEEDGIGQEVYDFLTWWTSGDIQGTYGVELEATMGPAMRYSPANRKAFKMIPWTSEERRLINEQWEQVQDVREIPGNYYISRSLTSALRLSMDNDVSARRQLLLYNEEINSEITRKRKEFGLE